jgi:hypothetical protein
MAITLIGANGLFTRLGRLIDLGNKVRLHQQLILTEIDDCINQYNYTSTYMIGTLIASRQAYVDQSGAVLNDVRTSIQNTVMEMAYTDSLLATTDSMVARTPNDALRYLIRQMETNGSTVQKTTITSSTSYGTNTGDGVLITSVATPTIGYSTLTQYPNVRSETCTLLCTQDAQNGFTSKYREQFTLYGQPSFESLDYRFPAGSGIVGDIEVVSAMTNAGGRYQNVLSNSGFESWQSNVPDNWTIVVGTAGTNIADGGSVNCMTGVGCLQFNSGSTAALPKITQSLKTSGQTEGAITPDRLMCLSFWVKQTGVLVGTLRVSLQDGAGNILNAGTFFKSVNLALATGSYVNYSYTAALPAKINSASEALIAVELTVAQTAKTVSYIDEITLSEMKRFDAGGPAFTIVTGGTPFVVNDKAFAIFLNNEEGEVQTEMDRYFGMYQDGLAFPATAGAPTVADTVIA